MTAAPSRLARRDCSIRRPQMAQKETDLPVGKLEDRGRHPLIARTLTIYPEIPEPAVGSGRCPAIAVARQQQLMPIAAAWIAGHTQTEFRLCSATHQLAALLRGGRVPHGLMLRVAAIANHVRQKSHAIVRPDLSILRLRHSSRDCEAVCGAQIAHSL